MSGLDNIISKIIAQAEQNAADIISKANKKADEIYKEARAKGEASVQAIIDDAQRKAENIIKIAKSTAALNGKKQMLKSRHEIISKVFDAAIERLCNLPEKQYFDTLASLIVRHAAKGKKGEVLFSSFDLKRLPLDFESTVNKMLESGSITISKETRNIKGGFILRYGSIEENCSFEAIFESKKDKLSDLIYREMFG